MQKLNGVWWTINKKQIPGELTITDENKIYLTTYEKLYDSNVIDGFVEGRKITLVDIELDRTDVYYAEAKNSEDEYDVINNTDIKYSKYKYTAQIAIFGHLYERKGDIRVRTLNIRYTNIDKWVEWKTENVKNENGNVLINGKTKQSKIAKLGKCNLSIVKPYVLTQGEYSIQINNETSILIDNIGNSYIESVAGILQSIQFFLILCMGDNINIEKLEATDIFGRQIEIILDYGKSNFENRTIFKNIIKYKDMENQMEKILKNWIEISENNGLLMATFISLQTGEELLGSEYTNLTTAIDSLYLLLIKKESTKKHFVDIVEEILKKANFAFNFSEEEITQIATKVKDARRYFVHANKTQKELVNHNVTIIMDIMTILIEVIRINLMLEIGIEKKPIEKYYKSVTRLEKIKQDIIDDINIDEQILDERIEEGKLLMNLLSKKDSEKIAKLNAIMGTHYRETAYDLENTEDLIQATQYITAEYIDYYTYWILLDNVASNFDQSLEVFHPEKWFDSAEEGKTGSELMDNIIISLREAEDSMGELMDITEEKCQEIWRVLLLGKNKEAQKYFIGNKTQYTKEEVEEAWKNVMENIYDINHENVVEKDCENFANRMKTALKEIRGKKNSEVKTTKE